MDAGWMEEREWDGEREMKKRREAEESNIVVQKETGLRKGRERVPSVAVSVVFLRRVFSPLAVAVHPYSADANVHTQIIDKKKLSSPISKSHNDPSVDTVVSLCVCV